jgi:hypothetical protein
LDPLQISQDEEASPLMIHLASHDSGILLLTRAREYVKGRSKQIRQTDLNEATKTCLLNIALAFNEDAWSPRVADYLVDLKAYLTEKKNDAELKPRISKDIAVLHYDYYILIERCIKSVFASVMCWLTDSSELLNVAEVDLGDLVDVIVGLGFASEKDRAQLELITEFYNLLRHLMLLIGRLLRPVGTPDRPSRIALEYDKLLAGNVVVSEEHYFQLAFHIEVEVKSVADHLTLSQVEAWAKVFEALDTSPASLQTGPSIYQPLIDLLKFPCGKHLYEPFLVPLRAYMCSQTSGRMDAFKASAVPLLSGTQTTTVEAMQGLKTAAKSMDDTCRLVFVAVADALSLSHELRTNLEQVIETRAAKTKQKQIIGMLKAAIATIVKDCDNGASILERAKFSKDMIDLFVANVQRQILDVSNSTVRRQMEQLRKQEAH